MAVICTSDGARTIVQEAYPVVVKRLTKKFDLTTTTVLTGFYVEFRDKDNLEVMFNTAQITRIMR